MRLIDADAISEKFEKAKIAAPTLRDRIYVDGVLAIIENSTTIDPVKHGKWLNFIGDFSTAECDRCGEIYEVSPDEKPCEDYFSAFKQFYKFCPNCGARMDGES